MKFSAKVLVLALMAGALLVTGCRKKPVRSTPDQTMQMGTADQNALNTQNLGDFATDPSLTARDPNIIEDANTIRGLLQPVYFDFDKFAIKQSEREKLTAAVTYLQQNPQMRLLLEGHCDWRGTAEYNIGLGDRRAAAVRQFLESLGVTGAKLELLSKGDLDAIENGTEDQTTKDRRVELVVLKPLDGANAAPIAAPPAAAPSF